MLMRRSLRWGIAIAITGLVLVFHTQISIFAGVIIALVLIFQIVSIKENQALVKDLQLAHAQVQLQAAALEQANQDMQAEIDYRRKAEEQLTHDALHDALTGLPNRALFLDRLGHAAAKKKRNSGFQYAVLFLDLDSFKVVNDSLGHVTGDQLLISIGQLLQSCVRQTDTVARLGGDEFVILLEDIVHADDSLYTADRLQNALRNPLPLKGTRVFISVSIGIVQRVDNYEYPEDILRDADLAMYQAKSHGKARYEIFHEAMRANAISRMALESDMRRALEEKEFVLHYQPILALPDQSLVSFEALVRWQHPEHGLMYPCSFIPLAEETGLILPLGKWVMQEACRQAYSWQQRFPCPQPVKVNVNVSGLQLKQPDFIDMVKQILEETHLPPECLVLEVTETVCLDSIEIVAETLSHLQALGVETQIDDFGTGYSSLSYLPRLPVRSIKIDRSFIHEIMAGEKDAPDIVRAIFSMVNDLGISAIAEGIENEAQLEALSRLHCDYVQGYLLARPMSTVDIVFWMTANQKQSN